MLTVFISINWFKGMCGTRKRKGLGSARDMVCVGHLAVTVFIDGEVSGAKPAAHSSISAPH